MFLDIKNFIRDALFKNEIAGYQQQISTLREVENTLEEQLTQVNATLESMDKTKKQLIQERDYFQHSLTASDSVRLVLIKEKEDLQKQIAELQVQISTLEAKLLDTTPDANQMNAAFPKVQLSYEKRYIQDEYAQKRYIKMYPQEFIVPEASAINQAKADVFNRFHPTNEQEIVEACWAWIMDDGGLRARYRPDDYFGTIWNDFWQFPSETIVLQKGDCEDLAILWASLAIKCGVPRHKVHVDLGMFGNMGHAYGIYKPSPTAKELLIESTQSFRYKNDHLTTLESHSEYVSYFAFNDRFMWKKKEGMDFGKLVEGMAIKSARIQHARLH
jgi:hypothetical protein